MSTNRQTFTKDNAADLTIAPGDHVELVIPGVREWKIPPVLREATVRDAAHAAAIRQDAYESIVCGGATVTVTR